MVVEDGLEILTERECRERLERAHIGRIAVTLGALPAIFPVNYAMLDGDVVFMTGEGTKLRAASRNAVLAFEIDAYDPLTRSGWSVLVVGMASELEGEARETATRLPLEPWARGDRDHYISISTDFVSGRRIGRVGRAGQAGAVDGRTV